MVSCIAGGHRCRLFHQALLVMGMVALSACGGSGGSAQPQSYTVGGTVSGLTGSLILVEGTGPSITVTSDGEFTFPGGVASGSAYSVTVGTQPQNQVCTVSKGSGTVQNANVTGIAVACVDSTYAIGGTVTGLGDETGLVLSNGGADATPVPADAVTFSMKTAVATGGNYSIAVQHSPPGVHCDVSNGTGTVASAAVANIQVTCGLPQEHVLHVFGVGTADGSTPYGGLVAARDGNYYGLTYGGGTLGVGTVYQVTPAGEETVLYSFAGGPEDGARPYGELIQASDGDLYGTTTAGGPGDFGVIFKVTLAGVETVLHGFAGAPDDGNYTLTGLVQAADGNFYGTTQLGGAGNQGTVFRMTPSGSVSVLHSFPGITFTDPAIPDGTLVAGNDGSLYGTTIGGGTTGNGIVFKITPEGAFTQLYSFQGGTSDAATPEAKLLLAQNGSFYGTAPNGGTGSVGVVFRVTPDGQETVLHSFAGAPDDGAYPQGSLIEGSDGNLYGTTYLGGAHNYGTVFRLTPAGEETVLFSFPVPANGPAGTGGQWPWSGVIETPDGGLIGTATLVYKLN